MCICQNLTSEEIRCWEQEYLTIARLDIIKCQQRPHAHETDGHQTHCVLVCAHINDTVCANESLQYYMNSI